MYREWYTTTKDGVTYELRKHIGKGTGRDSNIIRVAFDWDEDSQRVIVGYIGPAPAQPGIPEHPPLFRKFSRISSACTVELAMPSGYNPSVDTVIAINYQQASGRHRDSGGMQWSSDLECPAAAHWRRWRNIVTLAQQGEQMGFDILSVSDHIVVPTSIDSIYPYNETGEFVSSRLPANTWSSSPPSATSRASLPTSSC